MIPKTNMKVVIPNMNILGGDDEKPGFPLNAHSVVSVHRPSFESSNETHRRMWTEVT